MAAGPVLAPVPDGPAVVVCSTCRTPHADGGGAALAAALHAVRAGDPRFGALAIQEMPCLFACTAACTVMIRAPGRIGYVLGRFAPGTDAAHAILGFAAHHAASAEGEVPFRDWPEGVKGHFLVRVPPPGFVAR